MIVDLLNVGEPLVFEFTIDPNEIDLGYVGVKTIGDVRASGELNRSSAKIDVKGAIRAPLEIDCTRCLTPVRRELDITFAATFVGKEMFPEAKETHIEAGDLDTDVVEGNELDLTDVVREQILLNLPEQILCREDCKGICPTCGVDLNAGECECGGDEIDPRWAALKDLK
jgi:uncharacterized protein